MVFKSSGIDVKRLKDNPVANLFVRTLVIYFLYRDFIICIILCFRFEPLLCYLFIVTLLRLTIVIWNYFSHFPWIIPPEITFGTLEQGLKREIWIVGWYDTASLWCSNSFQVYREGQRKKIKSKISRQHGSMAAWQQSSTASYQHGSKAAAW